MFKVLASELAAVIVEAARLLSFGAASYCWSALVRLLICAAGDVVLLVLPIVCCSVVNPLEMAFCAAEDDVALRTLSKSALFCALVIEDHGDAAARRRDQIARF